MSESYYQKLKNLVGDGRLRIYIIIAPPRTNSSLVEHSLGNSPDIEHECHEPFLNARYGNFNPDCGYKQIYESIGGEQFIQSEKKTSVVVKEMSHWISINDEYKKLAALTNEPVLFLIRNPLLAVESRLRCVLKTLVMRHSIDLQRYLLNEIVIERGFQDWKDFAKRLKKDGYKERPDFLLGKEGVERIYNIPVLTVQNHLLNLKARRSGYVNWQDIIEKKLFTEHDYTWFGDVLKPNTRRLKIEKEEFKRLGEEVKYFEDEGRKHFIFDTTDLRADPKNQIKEICSKLGVTFSSKMIRWGERVVDFYTEQGEQFEELWYDTLRSSSRINPPIEIPPTIDSFPEFMQEYLKTDNLPIYIEISKKKTLKNRLRHELNEREFHVKITDSNKEYLCQLGLNKRDTQTGEKVSLKLKYIDPIYAISNDPELIKQPDFQIFRDKYNEEMKIISDIV